MELEAPKGGVKRGDGGEYGWVTTYLLREGGTIDTHTHTYTHTHTRADELSGSVQYHLVVGIRIKERHNKYIILVET